MTSNPKLPLSQDQLYALAHAIGGPEQVEQFKAIERITRNPDWERTENILFGYGHSNRPGLKVRRVNDKYNVVFWGGRQLEDAQLWNFHISRARPDAAAEENKWEFDERLDAPVTLAAENIRILVQGRPKFANPTTIIRTYIALREGVLGSEEGGIVYLEEQGKPLTVIKFPVRPRSVPPNMVILEL
ncbi:hypothetical protein DFH06DRAFT_1323397 [Mycena polygramma]|nr:hypothetical protein DFH06DRAFT_1323397 [Mycena polygramma]